MVHDCKTTPVSATAGAKLFLLEPWAPWWGDTPRGNWTSLFRGDGDDLLAIGCREPGVWVEPGRTQWDASVTLSQPNVAAGFQLRGFARKWLLASLSRRESVTDKDNFAPLPQQYPDAVQRRGVGCRQGLHRGLGRPRHAASAAVHHGG